MPPVQPSDQFSFYVQIVTNELELFPRAAVGSPAGVTIVWHGSAGLAMRSGVFVLLGQSRGEVSITGLPGRPPKSRSTSMGMGLRSGRHRDRKSHDDAHRAAGPPAEASFRICAARDPCGLLPITSPPTSAHLQVAGRCLRVHAGSRYITL